MLLLVGFSGTFSTNKLRHVFRKSVAIVKVDSID